MLSLLGSKIHKKRTYAHVEFQNFLRGLYPGPPLKVKGGGEGKMVEEGGERAEGGRQRGDIVGDGMGVGNRGGLGLLCCEGGQRLHSDNERPDGLR